MDNVVLFKKRVAFLEMVAILFVTILSGGILSDAIPKVASNGVGCLGQNMKVDQVQVVVTVLINFVVKITLESSNLLNMCFVRNST